MSGRARRLSHPQVLCQPWEILLEVRWGGWARGGNVLGARLNRARRMLIIDHSPYVLRYRQMYLKYNLSVLSVLSSHFPPDLTRAPLRVLSRSTKFDVIPELGAGLPSQLSLRSWKR
jgi:hypothetical protein